ncbi:MAG: sugar transferase [Frankiaceae bacterium]
MTVRPAPGSDLPAPARVRRVPAARSARRVAGGTGTVAGERAAPSARSIRWLRLLPLPGLVLRIGVRGVLLADLAAALAAVAILGDPGRRQLLVVVATLCLYAAGGLYGPKLSLSVLDEMPALIGRGAVAAALVTMATASGGAADLSFHLLVTAVAVTVGVCASRAACYAVVRAARRSGRVRHRTLIIGAGQVGARLARTLDEHREHGLCPIGFVDSGPLLVDHELPVPVLGAPDELADLLLEHRITVVIVAFTAMREQHMIELLRTCDRLECEIFFVPRLFELHATGPGADQVWGMPLVRWRRSAYRTVSWRLKRVLDIVVSALALIVLAPAMLACAIAVRLDGSPGVLFRQERVGLDGRPFQLLKFRSLRPADDDESRTRWNVAHDDRLGRVGRFLRRTSLDELPQLINILRGDMSLVGPRPERPYFVEQFARSLPRYTARHRVPAGLTGLAQIHGLRGDTSIEERARFDNGYIENWSLWVDLKILLRTIGALVRSPGR